MQKGGSDETVYNQRQITAAQGQCSQIGCGLTKNSICFTGLQLVCIRMIW